jgi:hypothetical protein
MSGLEVYAEKVLKELRNRMESQLGDRLVRIVLFGSRARGDFDVESDIDIAIIVRDLPRELRHQILDSVAELEMEYLTPVSVHILSESEFERLRRRERRFALDIEREGVPL